MGWSVAQHDTIPAVDLWLNPLEAHMYLFGFLEAAGGTFSPPYSNVRTAVEAAIQDANARRRPAQAPSSTVSDQRIRTWKSTFENFGFLYVNDAGVLSLSPLGRTTKELYKRLNEKIEGANDHLAQLAIEVLARHRLRNPIDAGTYPEDADLQPFKVIWKAMRQLDNKLHSEEMNRVLMHLTYARDVDGAIAHIREIRKVAAGAYSASPADLGTPVVEEGEETKRRITPWFTRAGFGGLLISADADTHGFRRLNDRYVPLVDQALADDQPIPADALATPAAYMRFVANVADEGGVAAKPGDAVAVSEVISVVKRFGASRIICLSGLPSTGKSRLARLVANELTDGDPYRQAEIQFHESTSYDDFVEGFAPKPSGEGFELVPKTLRIINRRAKLDPSGATYVLLIEEFTRANVHSVIGELLTYIEHRDRPFRLALSQEEERIAPNLVVVATMNPRDKSAVLLDAAIQRRIHRVEIRSSSETLQKMLDGTLAPSELAPLIEWFKKHQEILPFGHGIFAGAASKDDLKQIWQGTVFHLISDVIGQVKPAYVSAAAEYGWKS